MTVFTREQLHWMIRLLAAKGGKLTFPADYDGRELRPLNTLASSKMVKVKESRDEVTFTMTKRGLKEALST